MGRKVYFIDAPVDPKLEGGTVRFDLLTGDDAIHCVMSVQDFLESFARAAEVAHEWTGRSKGDILSLAKHSSRPR